jgi:FkbM family methyltransferase
MAFRSWRIDSLEGVLLGGFVVFVGLVLLLRLIPPPLSPLERDALWLFNAEMRPLQARYEADGRHSIGVEEWIVRDYFRDRRGGFFLDVGAADPIEHSNTYFLENRLGWSGIAIDARPEFAEAYRRHRPRTLFVPAFVANQDDARLDFYFLPNRPLASSSDRTFAETWKSGGTVEHRTVQTTTLNTLLSHAGASAIDFMSMDIELAELKALEGLDIGRYRPRLVGIEAHPEVRQELLGHFARHGYVLLGKYLRMDLQNLWLVPADGAIPSPEGAGPRKH